MHPAHRLPPEAAIAGEDEAFRLNVFQCLANEIGYFVRPLHLQRTMADDTQRDLFVLRNHFADMLEVHAAVEGTLYREYVDVQLIQVRQGSLVRLISARNSLCRRTPPACVAPHFALVAQPFD